MARVELLKFRLKRGSHYEAVRDDDGNKLMDGIKTKRRRYNWQDNDNNCIVESPVDLVEVLGDKKFERVGSVAAVIPSPPKSKLIAADLRKMDKAELIEFADEEEIDLEGATKKSEVLSTIIGALDLR